jgi:hypothetical protein
VAISGAHLPAGLPASPTIGPSPDPAALYVFLGTGTQTCADPLAALGCAPRCAGSSTVPCVGGRVSFRLPAALQQPGTIDLADPEIAASIEVQNASDDASCASLGSPSGELTITSIDAGGLSFTLFQAITLPSLGEQYDADGAYQATMCP